MGHARAGRDILRDLSASDRTRRTLAVVAAGRAALAEARPLIERMRGGVRGVDERVVDRALAAFDRAAAEPPAQEAR
jgi:hypothetical protein